jgi:hypothetical protein
LRQAPVTTTAATNVSFYGGSAVSADFRVFRIDDGFGTLSEPMTCSILTKNYDISISHIYKRLFWWGADMSSKTAVIGSVTPVTFVFAITWESLNGTAWNKLNTWAAPLATPGVVSTAIPGSPTAGARKFMKFLKGLRFRQANFSISTTTTGQLIDSPVRIFTLTAMVGQKQTVSASIS